MVFGLALLALVAADDLTCDLVILQHGLFGNHAAWDGYVTGIEKMYNSSCTRPYRVMRRQNTEYLRTFIGLPRITEAVFAQFSREVSHMRGEIGCTDLNLVLLGHSLGGLVLRKFIVNLDAHTKLADGVVYNGLRLHFPVFVTFATPHLGSENRGLASRLGSKLVGTGRDLMLSSDELKRLADDNAIRTLGVFDALFAVASTDDKRVDYNSASMSLRDAKVSQEVFKLLWVEDPEAQCTFMIREHNLTASSAQEAIDRQQTKGGYLPMPDTEEQLRKSVKKTWPASSHVDDIVYMMQQLSKLPWKQHTCYFSQLSAGWEMHEVMTGVKVPAPTGKHALPLGGSDVPAKLGERVVNQFLDLLKPYLKGSQCFEDWQGS